MAFSGNLVRQILPCCRRRHRRQQGQKRINDLQVCRAKPHTKSNSSSAEKHPNRRLLIAVDTANSHAKGDKNNRSSTSTKSTATLPPDAGRNSPTAVLIQPRTNSHCESAPVYNTHTKTCDCRQCVVAMAPRRVISCRRFSTKFKSKHEPALSSEDMRRSRCRHCSTSSYPSLLNKQHNSDLIEQKCTSI